MKKLSIIAVIFAIAVVAYPAQANVTLSDERVISGQDFTVTCASSAGYYAVFQNSSNKLVTTGSCTDSPVDENLSDVGNFKIMEVDATVASYQEALAATISDTKVVQVIPDFADADAASTISGTSYADFWNGWTAYATANWQLLFTGLAALIGLGFLIRSVKKHVGRRA